MKLLSSLMPLFQTEGEKLSDDRLIGTPFKHLSCEEENERHGKHIADNTGNISRNHGQAHTLQTEEEGHV